MNEYEFFAVGNFLSDFPAHCSYEQIMQALNHDDNCTTQENCALCDIKKSIVTWEALEYYNGEWLADNIHTLKLSLERCFVPKPVENIK